MTKQNLTYNELLKMSLEEMEKLADADTLTKDTLRRAAHFVRFSQRMSEEAGTAEADDTLSKDDVQEIWRETAPDDGGDVGLCPMLH